MPKRTVIIAIGAVVACWLTVVSLFYRHLHWHYAYIEWPQVLSVTFDGIEYPSGGSIHIDSYWGTRELKVVYKSGRVLVADVVCSPFDEDSGSISIDESGIHRDSLVRKVTESR